MPRILVVEDEEKLRRVLKRGLVEQGYEVATAEDGDHGWERVSSEAFDCIILDRMLPGRDGLQVLTQLRGHGIKTPVLMLTARAEVEDRVEGLDGGADDYLAKPFVWAELLARVRACLRRSTAEAGALLTVGPFRLDCVHRRLIAADEQIDLTDRECELLEYLMRNAGSTVTREQLARDVWREPELGLTNVVDVYVAKLRKRLERLGEPERIKTVRGSGYCFEE
jgi:two-component system copper resistance phosphate regulon response regulator CusR